MSLHVYAIEFTRYEFTLSIPFGLNYSIKFKNAAISIKIELEKWHEIMQSRIVQLAFGERFWPFKVKWNQYLWYN